MPTEILLMIVAFLMGGAFELSGIDNKISVFLPSLHSVRKFLYQAVVVYLLCKIGFKGGESILSESFDHLLFTSAIAVLASVLWTVFLLQVLKIWSPFNRLTQVSIATHFGSVSVGTFIAAMEYLSALGVEVSSSVIVWLAIMELPALFVGVLALKINVANIITVLKKDTMLWVLIGAVIFGIFGGSLISEAVNTFLFSTIFLPLLLYFLFEMGTKAFTSLQSMKGNITSLLAFGVGIPIVGGIAGAFLGVVLEYSFGEAFIFSILMASASYVLVPISLKEVLRSVSGTDPKKAEEAIATSMAMSVGITLPFNILIGFKVYSFFLGFFGIV